jgi:HEAT repeat protein
MRSTLYALVLSFACVACGPPSASRTAEYHLKKGDFAAATASADESLKTSPKDPTGWRVKIQAAMAQGEFERAYGLYGEWVELRGSHDATAYGRMAKTVLWQALQSSSPEIQARAIAIVEKHELEELAEQVREQLDNDNDLVAASAAVALLKSEWGAPQLASELLTSADARVRRLVVLGIGKKVGELARADIIKRLADKDATVRVAAVSVLGRWKNADDVEHLLRMARDKDARVRSAALRGLTGFKDGRLVELASDALGDSYLGARLAAVGLLDKLGGAEASSALRGLLDAGDLSVALRAASALYRRDKQEHTTLLEKAFASSSWMTRAAALNSAPQVAAKSTALALGGRGLVDSRIEVQIAAARLLLSFKVSTEATKLLRRALQSESVEPRLSAARLLAQRGDSEGLEVLSKLSLDGPIARRLRAIHAHRGARHVSTGLVGCLGADNIELRLAAADVLLE